MDSAQRVTVGVKRVKIKGVKGLTQKTEIKTQKTTAANLTGIAQEGASQEAVASKNNGSGC